MRGADTVSTIQVMIRFTVILCKIVSSIARDSHTEYLTHTQLSTSPPSVLTRHTQYNQHGRALSRATLLRLSLALWRMMTLALVRTLPR